MGAGEREHRSDTSPAKAPRHVPSPSPFCLQTPAYLRNWKQDILNKPASLQAGPNGPRYDSVGNKKAIGLNWKTKIQFSEFWGTG